MSRFTFIASDCELSEIDLSGIMKLTVKDLKDMNPRPESFWNLDELPDDCKALIIPDDADAAGLQISVCTNPPDGIEEYIKKKYIYWHKQMVKTIGLYSSDHHRTKVQIFEYPSKASQTLA